MKILSSKALRGQKMYCWRCLSVGYRKGCDLLRTFSVSKRFMTATNFSVAHFSNTR